MKIVRSVLFIAALATPIAAAAAPQDQPVSAPHSQRESDSPSDFIEKVRRATEAFRDATQVPAEYGRVLGCVSGPEEGAMGVHFVNPTLLQNDVVEASAPEALIYEFKDGVGRLVGVEYIVFADVWHLTHPPNDPPVLEDQLLHFNESPNRFGLPAFYELHVWAWRDNPKGAFVDWNPRVSCEGR